MATRLVSAKLAAQLADAGEAVTAALHADYGCPTWWTDLADAEDRLARLVRELAFAVHAKNTSDELYDAIYDGSLYHEDQARQHRKRADAAGEVRV